MNQSEWGDTELMQLRAAYQNLWRDLQDVRLTSEGLSSILDRHDREWPSLAKWRHAE